MVCLDSDIIINFLRKEKNALNLFEKFKSEDEAFITTSINSFELLKGIPKSSNMDKTRVLEFINNFEILNFDFESSKKAAEIFEDLKSKGDMIDFADIMIASIAITNDEDLITANLSHFKRIKELKLQEIK